MRAVALTTFLILAAGCGGESENAATTQETSSAEPTGRELFIQNCSGCHTLKEAGTTGKVGPNLDQKKPTKARVLFMLNNGGGGGLGVMPKFKGTLSDEQLQKLATYVSSVAGKA